MGWWIKEKDGKELNIGDSPLDTLDAALKKIARTYKRDLKRKPTSEEVAELLESSMRVIEEDLFDDMEERELESVTVKLRQRPKRPRPKPGDYFAIPLPSGGYGYGRVMRISFRVLLWLRLLDVHSESVLSSDDVRSSRVLLDLETGTQKLTSAEWPIVGHASLSHQEQRALENEPHWITNYAVYSIEEIAEWKLRGKRGLPPEMGQPYAGYRG